MVIDKKQVAERLREFAKKFDSIAELARLLEMKKPQQLQPYLDARSLPGFELLVRLRKLGLDLTEEGKTSSISAIKEEQPEYDSEEMRREVEEEVDRVVKIVQLFRKPIKPILLRELRQFLRGWFVKVIRDEKGSGKDKKGKKEK